VGKEAAELEEDAQDLRDLGLQGSEGPLVHTSAALELSWPWSPQGGHVDPWTSPNWRIEHHILILVPPTRYDSYLTLSTVILDSILCTHLSVRIHQHTVQYYVCIYVLVLSLLYHIIHLTEPDSMIKTFAY
jgi:hypothetical protein